MVILQYNFIKGLENSERDSYSDCGGSRTSQRRSVVENPESLYNKYHKDLTKDDDKKSYDIEKISKRIAELNEQIRQNETTIDDLKFSLDQARMIKSIAIKKVTFAAYEQKELWVATQFPPRNVSQPESNVLPTSADLMIQRQKDLQRKIALKQKREENLKFQALLCEYYKKLREIDIELERLDDQLIPLKIKRDENAKRIEQIRPKIDPAELGVSIDRFPCMIYKA